MVDKRLRRRTPVRIKQIRGVADELASWIGHEVSLEGFLEQAHYQETDLILVDRVPLAMKIEVGGEMGWPKRSELRGALRCCTGSSTV